MQLYHLVILIFLTIILVCMFVKRDYKEGMQGFGTITSLSMYNSPRHCWKGMYDEDDGEYCATNGRVIL